jgi:hypothetical protein
MTDLIKKAIGGAIGGAVKTIVPTQNVEHARTIRKEVTGNLSFSEKVNYKLHDRTTWVAVALIGFYGFTGNWAGVVSEIAPLFGFDIVQSGVDMVAK